MKLLLYFSFIAAVTADVYLHNPRGSNNRLDENGRNRRNANRMFDSQNNNRGGYNVGSLYYYEGSKLPIEWTNQHSCSDQNAHCEIILQYMCGEQVRDGIRTSTIPSNPILCKNRDCNSDPRYGMNENYDYYMNCVRRKRNAGLFTADQRLRSTRSARYTRQNPKGTRRGYECPEERDYYPYWHPTPWKDIAILTSNVSRCEMYRKESENVKGRWYCELPRSYTSKRRFYTIPNNKKECEAFKDRRAGVNASSGVWKFSPPHNLPPPECRQADWSRDNHLGNGVGGFTLKYNWTLPSSEEGRCVLRIRYNISSGDFDGWDSGVNAALNSKRKGQPTGVNIGEKFGLSSAEAAKRGFVYKQNPVVKIFGGRGIRPEVAAKLQLRLAINTAQVGRTFQDRTHVFAIQPRTAELRNKVIHNLNVRGKRGNIVQVYPAVEYDFVPNTLEMNVGEYLHLQWTGSNTNPRNNDGQGLRGTDRSNVVLLGRQVYSEGRPKANTYGHLGRSYPEHLDNTFFLGLSRKDLIEMATLEPGQFRGEMSELDDAGTYFDLGPRKVTATGKYNYMCTRNNNFSNRSQKGKIEVKGRKMQAFAARMGSTGGNIMFGSGSEGIWFEANALAGLETVSVDIYSPEEGEKIITDKGGRMTVGSAYASKVIILNPQNLRTQEGKKMTMKFNVDTTVTSTVQVYRSSEDEGYQTWHKVDAEIKDGMASIQTNRGGVYVARHHPSVIFLVGIAVGCLVLVCIIIGTFCYFRKRPEKLERIRSTKNRAKRSLQNEL